MAVFISLHLSIRQNKQLVSRMGLGGIPIQKIDAEGTKTLLHKLADRGVNYIDTARGYTVSEEMCIRDRLRTSYAEFVKEYQIRDNTILYEAFGGRGMICNPYALFLYLLDVYKRQGLLQLYPILFTLDLDLRIRASGEKPFMKEDSPDRKSVV